MPHRINYQAESSVPSWTDTKAIGDAAKDYADADADRQWNGIGYDEVNGQLRITFQWFNVSDINARLTDLDDGLSSINTNYGTDFPPASDVAEISPE